MVPAARPSQSRLAFLIVAISVLTVMAAAPAAAQIFYGSVVGAVRDSSGAVMPGATVMIVNKENIVEQRKVEIGALVDTLRVIESGVAPHDRIIASRLLRAIPGQKVDPQMQNAAMSAPVGR